MTVTLPTLCFLCAGKNIFFIFKRDRYMRILLIDNTKSDKVHFTRLLERRLFDLIGSENVIRCSTVEKVVEHLDKEDEPFDAAVLSGSTLNLSEPNRVQQIRKSLSALLRLTDTPILGICFGMQLISMAYGGVIKRMDAGFNEEASLHVREGSVLFHGLETVTNVTLSHQDFVENAPPDFETFGQIHGCIQVIESLRFLRFGVQFHPEKKATGATVCTLLNFCRFVQERCTLPAELSAINERCRIRFTLNLHRTFNLRASETLVKDIDRDTLMAIWRHHIYSWNIPAVLI